MDFLGSRSYLTVFLLMSLSLALSAAILPRKGKSTELSSARNKRDAGKPLGSNAGKREEAAILPGKGKSFALSRVRNKRDASDPTDVKDEEKEGVKKMVNIFQLDSSGEGSEEVNMAKQEKWASRNSGDQEQQFDIALAFNLSGIVFFLCGTFSWI